MQFEFGHHQTFCVGKESCNDEKRSIVHDEEDRNGAGDRRKSQKDEYAAPEPPPQDGHQSAPKLDKGVQVPPSQGKSKESLCNLKREYLENFTFGLLIFTIILGVMILYAIDQANRDLSKQYAQAQETLINKEEQIRKLNADATLERVNNGKATDTSFSSIIEWVASSGLLGGTLRFLDILPD